MRNEMRDVEVFDGEPELLTSNELLAHLLQDIIAGEDPEALVEEFINDFVLSDRSETTEMLTLLEMDTSSLVALLKGVVAQSYQESVAAVDQRGAGFIEELKTTVKTRLTEMAAPGGP